MNVSKSGISTSLRTKYGSIGATGFSIRTGIPGLYYRNYNSRKRSLGDLTMVILIVLSGIIFLLVFFYLSWIVIRFIYWIISEIFKFIYRQYLEQQMEVELAGLISVNHYMALNEDLIGAIQKFDSFKILDIFQSEFSYVEKSTPLFKLAVNNDTYTIYASEDGVLDYYFEPDQPIFYNDIICSIKSKHQ